MTSDKVEHIGKRTRSTFSWTVPELLRDVADRIERGELAPDDGVYGGCCIVLLCQEGESRGSLITCQAQMDSRDVIYALAAAQGVVLSDAGYIK